MLILISGEILFNFGGFNMNLLGFVFLFVLFIKQNHRFLCRHHPTCNFVVLENQLYKKKLKSLNFKF